MNTDCSKCIFSDNNNCLFNIVNLIKDHYNVVNKNGSNYIESYKCSYAFSKDKYEEHKKDLGNIKDLVVTANKLHYYLIVCCVGLSEKDIIDTYNKIEQLHTKPQKLSLVCDIKKSNIKNLIDYLNNKSITTDWKIHNLTTKNVPDTEKLFDILNTNVINTVSNIWYIHHSSISSIHEDINYINFLSKVLKPKYPAIRKNDINLDGLFISAKNLRLIKNEHEEKYIKFLQENNTLVRKYYE